MQEDAKQVDIMSILSGKEVVKAFRVDLAVWSTYFYTLFLSDFKDSRSAIVNLEDVDASVLKGLIHALYKGKVHLSNSQLPM